MIRGNSAAQTGLSPVNLRVVCPPDSPDYDGIDELAHETDGWIMFKSVPATSLFSFLKRRCNALGGNAFRPALLVFLLVLLPGIGAMRAAVPEDATAAQPGDYVVLLHGLKRTAYSMRELEWALKQEHYRVINVSYPSTDLSIPEIADHWLADVLKERITDPTARVHFVTHSMGGIVLRQYLSNHQIAHLGRVVMLAPPNQGSELVDKFKRLYLFRLIAGPSGQELGTSPTDLPKQLGPAHFEVGIIAGDRSLNPIFHSIVKGPNDGKVSVQSAQLEGMKDFLVVHHSHTLIIWRKDVRLAVERFLKSGHFAA